MEDSSGQNKQIELEDLLGKESPDRKKKIHYSGQKERLSPTTNKSALTAEKLTNASPESISLEMRQANQNRIVASSVNLTKRLVQAKEHSHTYQEEALKKEEL